ncbi:MAG: hypothetical protein AB7V55_02280 [Oscillospiraceae bacterium]
MSVELEKGLRIITDLVSLCYYEGADEFKMELHMQPDSGSTLMEIECPMPGLPEGFVDQLCKELSLHRQHEVEQTYWELSGETDLADELTLVGMMVDKAHVTYNDGVLHIKMWRKE